MGGTSSMREAVRELLLKACEVGLDYLVMRLAFGRCDRNALSEVLSSKGIAEVRVFDYVSEDLLRSIARETWGYWKCGGKHHWLLRGRPRRLEGGVLIVRVACYACKLEREVLVEEAEIGGPTLASPRSLQVIVTSILEGERGC